MCDRRQKKTGQRDKMDQIKKESSFKVDFLNVKYIKTCTFTPQVALKAEMQDIQYACMSSCKVCMNVCNVWEGGVRVHQQPLTPLRGQVWRHV